MPENSRKSTQIVMVVGLAGVLASAGLHLHGRIDDLQARLEKLESESRVLSPLVSVMSAHRPGAAISAPYQGVQATGAPNVPSPGSDSALAWCPASENSGSEWLELSYEKPVSAAELQIHASFNPGAITRVLIGGSTGPLQELPIVPGPPLAVQALPVSPPLEVSRVKLELDTAAVPRLEPDRRRRPRRCRRNPPLGDFRLRQQLLEPNAGRVGSAGVRTTTVGQASLRPGEPTAFFPIVAGGKLMGMGARSEFE